MQKTGVGLGMRVFGVQGWLLWFGCAEMAFANVCPGQRPLLCRIDRSRRLIVRAKVGRTAYREETGRLLKAVLTRQAVKTLMHYLSETNGELHFYLHNYVSKNPVPIDGTAAAEDWLVRLASTPWTTVKDPRRSSVVSHESVSAAIGEEREVSPRELAERILKLRTHIAEEMIEDMGFIDNANEQVLRKALARTLSDDQQTV